jgi:hypothetical protein
MMYVDEKPSCDMIFLPSIMNIDTNVHENLRFCLINLSGCNVYITDERELLRASLR